MFLKNHQTATHSYRGKQKEYAFILVTEKYKEEMDAIRPSLSVLISHLDYIGQLVGVDYVGMGSDFDGIEAPPLGVEWCGRLSTHHQSIIGKRLQ